MNQLRIYAYQLIDPNYICNAEWAKILKNIAILEKKFIQRIIFGSVKCENISKNH